MIIMQGIRKEYRMGDNVVAALDGVDIHIKPHEFVSIIGPSGSGKSTLMNIIGCLDTADEGTYIFDGQEISDYSEDELATIRGKKIGFVFQQFNLLPKLTARENVELPLIYQGVSARRRHERRRRGRKSCCGEADTSPRGGIICHQAGTLPPLPSWRHRRDSHGALCHPRKPAPAGRDTHRHVQKRGAAHHVRRAAD